MRKRSTKSFEPDEDVAQILADAEAAGVLIKDMANESIRRHGKEVAREHMVKLRERADLIEKRFGLQP